ncbi:MAG TPA: CheR family methyltransferase, partial [Clostridia bacterium]|nr:CheR family methyltransferase [Clostridia bacterium]
SLNLPIDIFLRSLAEDQKERSIGIILSGTGSDGTLGIRAVKGAGGLVFAQDNISAKFDGMPRSASATGMVDYVLPPEEITQELARIIKHPLLDHSSEKDDEIAKQHSTVISKMLSRIRDVVGVDFSAYKDSTVIRRIERRIGINQLDSTEEYAAYLESSIKEVHVLYKDLLIGVTRFFRDKEAFDRLKETAVQDLLKEKHDSHQLRLWCMACSTGEEAYSLAILFYEKMQELNIEYDVKIFATDIDRDSIEYAGLGVYPESIVTDVNQERLQKFFTKKENTFHVNPEIRRMVIFANHNVMQDPPFSAIDMVTCRNMLIYLKPEIQQRVLGAFHFSIKKNGYLFLGSSETVGELSGSFAYIDTKWKIYQCKQKTQQSRVSDYFVPPLQPNKKKRERFPEKISTHKSGNDDVLESAYDFLVHEYVPPTLLIDRNLSLIHVCREASDFMKVPTGKISLNVLDMLPHGIKAAVSTAVHKSLKEDGPITYRDLSLKDGQHIRYIDLSVRPVLDRQNNPAGYFLVMLEDHEGRTFKTEGQEKTTFDDQQNKMIADLEQELQFTKENLQATIEELETSNEELQATNEELIASNEELQSTNEELQSVNEELYTVNAEYQNKIEELSEANNDVKNFLNNTDIGMVFLDKEFKIRKYTPAVTEVINIMEMDVGRPIDHITRNIEGQEFMDDINKVLMSLVPIEKEIVSKTGKWFLMKILPYRTVNNVVEGIVITFLDIDEKKRFEEKLEQERNLLMRILENSPIAKTMVDQQGNIVFANQKAAEVFGIDREEILQRGFGDRGWKITDSEGHEISVEDLPFSKIMQNHEPVYDYVHSIEKPDGSIINLRISGAPLFSETNGDVEGAVFSIQQEK